MLEQLNDARADPAAFGRTIGLDLSGVAPSQPLAWDARLVAAGRGHSQDMNDRAYFGHVDASGGRAGQRISAEGFAYSSWGESIAAGYPSVEEALKGLIVDAGVADLGHRRHLLAMDPLFQNQSQVGIGLVKGGSGPYHDYFTIDTAAPTDPRPFLTGVVFNDLNQNGKYDVGEGLGGVTITVQGVGTTTSFASGGYSLQLNPGTYVVSATGGGLTTPFTRTVTVGAQNLRLPIVVNDSGSPALTPLAVPQPPAGPTVQPADVQFVQNLFQSYLRRAPVQLELDIWAGKLSRGEITRDSLTALIRSSDEYRAVTTVWLRQLYRDALGP